MNWREIEAELVDIARADAMDLDEETNTGDKFIPDDDGRVYINLTTWAKALADRLSAKATKVKAGAV